MAILNDKNIMLVGLKGERGYGVSEADKEEIVKAVLAQLPTYDGTVTVEESEETVTA